MNVDPNLLLMVESAGIGDGEPDLGEKLMKAFLTSLLDSGQLPAKCVFVNSGIFLTTEGSPVLEQLQAYAAGGSEILSCGTCLDYYQRKDKLVVGAPTNMRDTVNALLSYDRVLRS